VPASANQELLDGLVAASLLASDLSQRPALDGPLPESSPLVNPQLSEYRHQDVALQGRGLGIGLAT
jgi:hypothetical protein